MSAQEYYQQQGPPQAYPPQQYNGPSPGFPQHPAPVSLGDCILKYQAFEEYQLLTVFCAVLWTITRGLWPTSATAGLLSPSATCWVPIPSAADELPTTTSSQATGRRRRRRLFGGLHGFLSLLLLLGIMSNLLGILFKLRNGLRLVLIATQ